MGQVNVEVNGKPYLVGCEDGQERHLAELAAKVDAQVRLVAADVGALGETRLMLMGALVMADEMATLRGELERLKAELARAKTALAKAESLAVSALEAASDRIERLAPQ